jgi:hypothetical protein
VISGEFQSTGLINLHRTTPANARGARAALAAGQKKQEEKRSNRQRLKSNAIPN